jgi:hypothetical protein
MLNLKPTHILAYKHLYSYLLINRKYPHFLVQASKP